MNLNHSLNRRLAIALTASLCLGLCAASPPLAAEEPVVAEESAAELATEPKAAPAPVTIEADYAEIDERKAMSVYTGNVVLTQGNLQMQADKVTVHTREGKLERVYAWGSPVTYRQERENEAPIHGHSLRMEYDAGNEVLLLLDQAQLWQDKNHFSGERIEYSANLDRVVATGGNGTEGQPTGRVKIILQPKAEADNEATTAP